MYTFASVLVDFDVRHLGLGVAWAHVTVIRVCVRSLYGQWLRSVYGMHMRTVVPSPDDVGVRAVLDVV